MSIGFTQLIILLIVALIFFGNLPKLFKDLSTGLLTFKQALAKSAEPSLKSAFPESQATITKKANADLPEEQESLSLQDVPSGCPSSKSKKG